VGHRFTRVSAKTKPGDAPPQVTPKSDAVDSDGATNAAPERTDSPSRKEASPKPDDVAQKASLKPDDAPQTHKATRPYFLKPAATTCTTRNPHVTTARVPSSASTPPQENAPQPPYPARVGSRIPWSDLIRFCFREDLTVCPKCGGKMLLIAAIGAVQANVVQKVLSHLRLPIDGSAPSPARLPPQLDLDLDPDETWSQQDEPFEVDQSVMSSRGPP
jgi:hypothetical protein